MAGQPLSTNRCKLADIEPDLRGTQILITKAEHPFLEYDSWMDCSEVCRKFNNQAMEYIFKNGTGKRHCFISDRSRVEILAAVAMSEKLSTGEQQVIGVCLSVDKRSG